MILPDPETCRQLAEAVAPRWVWMPGMLTTHYGRVREETSVDWDTQKVIRELVVDDADESVDGAPVGVLLPANALPDLTDPLTAIGAELVLHAIAPTFDVVRYGGAWAVIRPPIEGAPGLAGMLAGIVARGATRLEAVIAAILAAPETS